MADAKEKKAELEKDSSLSQEPTPAKDTKADTDSELFDSEPKADDKDLDLEVEPDKEKGEEKPKDTKSAQAEKHRQAWLIKILDGDAEVKDAPKWLQVSLHAELKAIEKTSSIDVDAKIEEKLAEREAARDFKSLRTAVNKLDLTAEQKGELSSEFKDLRKAGLPGLQALEKAMKIAGISLDDTNAALRQSMQLPPGGTAPKESKFDTPEEIMKITDTVERAKHWERLAKQGQLTPR